MPSEPDPSAGPDHPTYERTRKMTRYAVVVGGLGVVLVGAIATHAELMHRIEAAGSGVAGVIRRDTLDAVPDRYRS